MRLFLLSFLIIAILPGSIAQSPAKSAFGKELADILEHTKMYSLALIRQMPEQHWEYRPTPESRSFREQVEHMATVLDFQCSYVLSRHDFQENAQALQEAFGQVNMRNSGKSTEALLERLEENYDTAIRLLRGLTKKDLRQTFFFFFLPDQPEKSMITAAMAMRDHLTHHRAQLIVYLRLRGVEPVTYQAF